MHIVGASSAIEMQGLAVLCHGNMPSDLKILLDSGRHAIQDHFGWHRATRAMMRGGSILKSAVDIRLDISINLLSGFMILGFIIPSAVVRFQFLFSIKGLKRSPILAYAAIDTYVGLQRARSC